MLIAELLRSPNMVYFKLTNNMKENKVMKNNQTIKCRKVAFYGRVSTEHEAQTYALSNQMQWYEELKKSYQN